MADVSTPLRHELVKLWAAALRERITPAHESLLRLEGIALVLLIPQPPFPPWFALVGDSLGALNPQSPQQERLLEIDGPWPATAQGWRPLAIKLCQLLGDLGLAYQQVWLTTKGGAAYSAGPRGSVHPSIGGTIGKPRGRRP